LNRARKYYLYKLIVDNGGAPCVKNGLLSLAICKPAIRRTAEKGDIIIGFAANSVYPDNRVIYIAQVTKKLDGKKYYSQHYADRPDCIYLWNSGNFSYRRRAKYHSKRDLMHDLGRPLKFPSAQVLLSRKFRYFGEKGCRSFHGRFPHIGAKIRSLARGHRAINLPDDLWRELARFSSQLLKRKSGYSRTPVPNVRSTACLRTDGGSIECQR
jgi:hypothetical protein